MSEVLLVDETTFSEEVLKSDLPVVVEFFSNWCGGCKNVLAELIEMASELAGRVKVVKIDTDESPELAQQYNLMSIPSVFLFKGESFSLVGTGSSELSDLASKVKSLI